MGLSSTPYGTQQDYIPAVGDTERWKFAGLGGIQFPTLTDMLTYTAKEKVNITGSSALWKNNQEFNVATEFPAKRFWLTSGQHARTVRIEGTQFALDADDDNVLFATGIPAGGTGAVGDVSVDLVNRMIYKKTGASAWTAYLKVGFIVPWATALTGATPLTLADMNRTVPFNSASTAALTLPLAADAWALQPGGFIEVFIQGVGIPTFAVQSGQAALLADDGPGGAQYRSIAVRVVLNAGGTPVWKVQS